MRLQLRDNLPFIAITIIHQGKKINIKNVLIDTGSGGTIVAADVLSKIGVVPQAEDTLHTIFGVGGMDYGFNIQGILGMDFLTSAGAIIDLNKLEIEFNKPI